MALIVVVIGAVMQFYIVIDPELHWRSRVNSERSDGLLDPLLQPVVNVSTIKIPPLMSKDGILPTPPESVSPVAVERGGSVNSNRDEKDHSRRGRTVSRDRREKSIERRREKRELRSERKERSPERKRDRSRSPRGRSKDKKTRRNDSDSRERRNNSKSRERRNSSKSRERRPFISKDHSLQNKDIGDEIQDEIRRQKRRAEEKRRALERKRRQEKRDELEKRKGSEERRKKKTNDEYDVTLCFQHILILSKGSK